MTMCDGDKVMVTVEFEICFQYPDEGRTGYIWVTPANETSFRYGGFEKLIPEGSGPPFFRHHDRYFRNGHDLESYIAGELPKTIVSQMAKRTGV